jgi:hypothetical protein
MHLNISLSARKQNGGHLHISLSPHENKMAAICTFLFLHMKTKWRPSARHAWVCQGKPPGPDLRTWSAPAPAHAVQSYLYNTMDISHAVLSYLNHTIVISHAVLSYLNHTIVVAHHLFLLCFPASTVT